MATESEETSAKEEESEKRVVSSRPVKRARRAPAKRKTVKKAEKAEKAEKAIKLPSERIGTLLLAMRQDGRGPLPDLTEDHALSPTAGPAQKRDPSLRVTLITRPVAQRKPVKRNSARRNRIKRKFVASPAAERVGERRILLRSNCVNSS